MVAVIVIIGLSLGLGLGLGLKPESNSNSNNFQGVLAVSNGGTGKSQWVPDKFIGSDNTGNEIVAVKSIPTGNVVGTTDVQNLTNKTLINGLLLGESIIKAENNNLDLVKLRNPLGDNISKINSIGSYLGPVTVNDNATDAINIDASNEGELIVSDSALPVTITVPNTLPVGFNCQVVQKGVGLVTFSPAPGALIDSKNASLSLFGQYAIGTLTCVSNSDLLSARYILTGDVGSPVLSVVLVPITAVDMLVGGLYYYNYGTPTNLVGNLASTVTINAHATSGSYITCSKSIYRVYTQINLQFLIQPLGNRTFYNLNITPITSLPVDVTATSGAESTPIANNNFRQDRKLEWYNVPTTSYINVTVNSNAAIPISFNSGYFLLQIIP